MDSINLSSSNTKWGMSEMLTWDVFIFGPSWEIVRLSWVERKRRESRDLAYLTAPKFTSTVSESQMGHRLPTGIRRLSPWKDMEWPCRANKNCPHESLKWLWEHKETGYTFFFYQLKKNNRKKQQQMIQVYEKTKHCSFIKIKTEKRFRLHLYPLS